MSLPVTEDTPPDMLAGSMDLNVVLPNGKNVKMSIQRSTPMMDLLVQATTAHRLSPGNYSIQAMGERGVLPYKPSTPIGTLDAFKIKIVDKKLNSHKKAPQVPQAFLNTFRLQVNLPRSQLFVARVVPDITLSEVLRHVCTEKNLDINKYEFRNPAKPDEVLDLEKSLGYYKIQELSLVNKNKRICGGLSAADILHVKSSMLRQNSVCDSSLSSGSLGSRSTSPVPVNLPRVPPQPPVRKKRRPAPKPPQIAENESKEETKTSRSGLISHSRESSDSSGYHEASVLSESPTHGGPLARSESSSPPDTLPRHGKLLPSQSFTNLSTMQPAPRTRLASSVSNASLNSNGASRKKRAAPPPPSTATYRAPEEKMKSSTLPTSRAEERIVSNVPFVPVENGDIPAVEDTKVETVENCVEIDTKVDSEIVVKPEPKPRTMLSENSKEREKKVSIITSQTESAVPTDETSAEPPPENSSSENLKVVKSDPKMATDEDREVASNPSCLERWQKVDSLACLNEDEAKATKTAWLLGDSEPENVTASDEHDSLNWQYQLPPPPTDFRDSHSPICTELGTVTIMPDMYKEEVTCAREPEGTKIKDCLPREAEEEEVRTPQKKMAVMNELTNVLSSDGWKAKKSSSVTNLYASDETNNRKTSGLSYSRSFTNDFPPKGLKLPAYETYGAENNRDENYEKEIRYKNNRNLEKSLSMECIQSRTVDDHGRAEECFRRPVAPVQKKLKVARRSASTMGYNLAPQRKSDSDLNCNGDSDNIDDLLRQHFLDFLKERKLTNDLSMKSLDVIRHILPQINGEKPEAKDDPVPKSPVKGTDLVKKSSALLEREVKENVVVIESEECIKEAEVRTKEPEAKKADPVKRFSYHAPPSINFATWGERPKTQVLIKDEDYVTEVAMKVEKKPAEAPKPAVQKKPSALQFKKPGVKSHYEMFSALPKKKEVTPLTLIQMEEEEEKKKRKAAEEKEEEERRKRAEEERKKRTDEAREPSRVPVVCAVELKKEFREQQQRKGVVSEVTIKPDPVPPHSVSIYVNGSQRNAETAKPVVSAAKPFVATFPVQKRSAIMPVVKGFRTAEDQQFQSHVNINKVCKFTSHIGNQIAIESKDSVPKSRNSKHVTEVCLPPPPPPPPIFGPVNLKPVSARKIQPKTESADLRGQLMAEIRNFRGFNLQKLKTAQ